jgi:hypothetical protein
VGGTAPPAEGGGFLGPWTTAYVASVKARLLERRRAPCAVGLAVHQRAAILPWSGRVASVCGWRTVTEVS